MSGDEDWTRPEPEKMSKLKMDVALYTAVELSMQMNMAIQITMQLVHVVKQSMMILVDVVNETRELSGQLSRRPRDKR